MTGSAIRWDGHDLVLQIRVQPRAGRDEISGIHGQELRVRIKAAPVDGKGNDHLIRFLAKTFRVTRKAVILESGKTARSKRFRIQQPRELPVDFPPPP